MILRLIFSLIVALCTPPLLAVMWAACLAEKVWRTGRAAVAPQTKRSPA